MKQYIDLVKDVMENGDWEMNARTGQMTQRVPGAMMRMNLQQGFPAITTKKVAFKSAVGETLSFLRAMDDAADFRTMGTKVWDQNANDNLAWLANPYRAGKDALGPVYGVQWRKWPAYKVLDFENVLQVQDATEKGYKLVTQFVEHGVRKVLFYKPIDQLRQCLDTIRNDPSNRRIIFHAWNPAQLEEMALPPCHLLYQFLVNETRKEISLVLYIRSNDLGLGTPFNLIGGAVLTHLVGRLTGYTPKWFTHFIGDAHIYQAHTEMPNEQLKREPYPLPKLAISDSIPEFAKTGVYEPEWLEKALPSHFTLEGYQHHPPLTAPMAV
jgi:thymidylate synthase